MQGPICDELLCPDMTDEMLEEAMKEPIAAPFDCPECSTNLAFHIEPLPTENIGLGISVVRV